MSNDLFADLSVRANAICELCGAGDGLEAFEIPPVGRPDADQCALLCETCRAQISSDDNLDENHWHCLQQSAWSETPAVQVLAFRILSRLPGHAWAQDLLGQIYLDEQTLAWAAEGIAAADGDVVPTLDSNGTRLADGDTVQVIKDLDVKGANFVAKRGTMVKNIRLSSNPEHVDGRINGTAIVLKTCFLKKAN